MPNRVPVKFSSNVSRFNSEVTSSAAVFQRLMRQAARTVSAGIVEYAQGVYGDLFERIVMRTPVRTGAARGEWQISLRQPATDVLMALDPGGARTARRGERVLSQMEIGDTVYIQNNLEYISQLENGSSKQAPRGMVALSLMEMGGAA